MDKLYRDITRMEYMVEDPVGTEGLALGVRLGDFVRYYFARFLSNVRFAFKDFAHSEIAIFNQRHGHHLPKVFADPLLKIDDVLIAIPKGMVGSYGDTLHALMGCLTHIEASKLLDDLDALTTQLLSGNIAGTTPSAYTNQRYEADKKTIGHLFALSGPTVSTGHKALGSLTKTAETNTSLLALTREYYPQAMVMNKTIESLEKAHGQLMLDPKAGKALSGRLLSLAYRVSIYATVLTHIQLMEHSFVAALTTLRNASTRT